MPHNVTGHQRKHSQSHHTSPPLPDLEKRDGKKPPQAKEMQRKKEVDLAFIMTKVLAEDKGSYSPGTEIRAEVPEGHTGQEGHCF